MMRMPPFLLSAGLIFWGWQTGLWAAALPMALMLEGSRCLPLRWDFSSSDFSRVSDLCALLVVAIILYFYASRQSLYIIFELIQWLPVAFFPLLLVQNYSTAEKIDMRAISLIFRRQQKKGNRTTFTEVNLNHPYLALCILAASFANLREPGFYIGLMILVAWALWPIRRKGSSPVLWSLLLVVAFHGGYAGHLGLHRLQELVERKGMEWFFDLKREVDPYRSIAALGYIGALKPSNRILFRVVPEPGSAGPFLLREASYNHYRNTQWYAHPANFSPVPSGNTSHSWRLGNPGPDPHSLRVLAPLSGDRAMLKLPTGAFQVDSLPVLEIDRNPYGAVRVEGGPGLTDYTVRFGAATPLDSRPEAKDLSVPETASLVIADIGREAGIYGLPNPSVPDRLEAFFEEQFAYTLDLDLRRGDPPLNDFLKRSRAGHCEYFATAAVLLLRSAGIPARYAVGFSVHEESPFGDRLVVRSRHAHAWALAYIDGNWRDVDVTPSGWAGLEAETAPFWQPLSDFFSWLRFRISQWRWRESRGDALRYLIWPGMGVLLFMAMRLLRKKRLHRKPLRAPSVTAPPTLPGRDSPFYRIEERLFSLGWTRTPGEPVRTWLYRLKREIPDPDSIEPLFGLVSLHYRYRFDPRGLPPREKADFEARAEQWLASDPGSRVGCPEKPAAPLEN